MTEYVFVYNGEGAGLNSSYDLKELFIRYGIYESSDVSFTDFNSNFEGLSPSKMTIVLPGGSAINMGNALLPNKTKIQDFFAQGCKGLFVCSGAYLATDNADMFLDNYTRNTMQDTFNPLKYGRSTFGYYMDPRIDLNLNIIHDYKALGPFIPNDSYCQIGTSQKLEASIRKSYCTNLLLEQDQRPLKQMYMAGCGFESVESTTTTPCEVVATYNDQNRYSFFYPSSNELKTIIKMPAIIRKPGILLAGPHIETCVEDSRLLKLFQDGGDKILPAINADEYNAEQSRELIIPLLQETLRL